WYPSVEEGNDKGVVVLVTSQKEGAVTGGPAFVQAVGESILDATVSENLPGTSLWLVDLDSLLFFSSMLGRE
ncbi:thylakoid lumen 18.3 kDa protein, partial [Trifolium medium]|nr:thylakoid lumen 18.3 kDa protein [Trifolium medium]